MTRKTHAVENGIYQFVWVINPGSSNIKWSVYRGLDSSEAYQKGQFRSDDKDQALRTFREYPPEMAIVRFVHGGPDIFDPKRLRVEDIRSLKARSSLAPLHNPASIRVVEMLFEQTECPAVIAVFDTQFFECLPLVARTYGLPAHLNQKYNIRRYGFHGFAHQSMLNHWEQIARQDRGSRLVTVQLGSGCSMAAILNGQPIDTTMGFTPNEGLLMRTRTGDLDPGLLTWLQVRESWSPAQMDDITAVP